MTGRKDPVAANPPARALLDYLGRPDYRPLPQRALLHKLNVPPAERAGVRKLIRTLVDSGKIVKLGGGRLAPAPAADTLTGKLQRHRDGYGFVVPDDGTGDVFIAARNIGEAMSGDRVTVRVTRRGRDGRMEGVILRTVERRSRRALGVFRLRGRAGTVQPFDPGLSEPVRIPGAFRMGARDAQAVEIELLRPAGLNGPAEGKVLEVLGNLDDPGVDVLVLARKYGLALEFDEDVLAEAAALPARVPRAEAGRRERFDDPAPVTIDGETAKDFDDAIAVVETGDGFRLYVHIADVAHFVRPDGALDAEAQRRGTSVYFPHRVLPMFPERLSNDLCSLRPRVDRLVQSAVLDIDRRGKTRRVRFADGVIRSAARLTYRQVAQVIDGDSSVPGVPAAVVPMLLVAERLRRVLERRRLERGSVDFDLPEPQILLDVEGEMTGVRLEPRNAAHRLIEECMLAANEAVAAELERRGAPCMFRVHEEPDAAKIEVLEQFVQSLGATVPRRPAGKIQTEWIRRLLEPFEGRAEQALVSQVALRSMKRAVYLMSNSGHFGLAAPSYCHFTSPIRRYPDLVVHRLLRAMRSGSTPDDVAALDAVANRCSDLERAAEAAERELLVWKKVAFIADSVGETFAGVVTGVASFGLFVQLAENLVEGLVRVERLGAEFFEFDERRFALRGTGSGRVYRLGDTLRVRVDRVDRVLMRVDFTPEDQAAAGETGGARGRGRPRRRGTAETRGDTRRKG